MLNMDPVLSERTTTTTDKIEGLINQLRPKLPIQNPMPFFVHNNPLQFWEQFPFEEGLSDAVLLYENAQEEKSRMIWRDLEDFVIPVVLSYFDQGLNRWPVTSSKKGLWSWYCSYIESSFSFKSAALSDLKQRLDFYKNSSPLEVITRELAERCQNEAHWLPYLQTLIFHFKGWSGMIQVLERNPNLFPIEATQVSLLDWIAILLTAEKSLSEKEKKNGRSLWNSQLIDYRRRVVRYRLEKIKRRELNFFRETIRQFQSHIVGQLQKKADIKAKNSPLVPDVQVLFCLDDREESLRRALESTNSNYETFGTLGFFGVDFSLKRPGHVIYQPQCPPVINPRKKAEERVSFERPTLFRRLRQALPYLNESRFTFVEPLLALVLWPLYATALTIRSFSPGFYHRLRDWLRIDHYLDGKNSIHFIEPYTLDEKVTLVGDILASAGLGKIQSKLIIVLGHAATTTNNPFQKSYGCGACSGQAGFSNAKAFAEFANDPEVRKELLKKNVQIDDEVRFLAACHDTCSDQIYYAPSEILPDKYQSILKSFKKDMATALKLNQQERWQQFRLSEKSLAGARSSDWSQPRPEFGHTGVALAVFGPRWLTQGLDLKRRAFLISYDPDQDVTGNQLAFNILNALPVCANINLDYFTSRAFPEAMGAGSKLPLNIASGIGLMSGSKGDLRIGLATQMVDQHEPLRLIAFVYGELKHFQAAIAKSGRLQAILRNNWIHLIRIDPATLKFEALTDELRRELNHEFSSLQ